MLVAGLTAMICIPLGEAILRRFFGSSIPQAAVVVQHLVLMVALVGGAVAARQKRLLVLSTLAEGMRGQWGSIFRIVVAGFSAAVAVGLAYAGWRLIQVDEGLVILGVKLEHLLWLMPVCFGLAAVRMIWSAGRSAHERGTGLILGGVFCACAFFMPPTQPVFFYPWWLLLLLSAIFGAPIFVILGGAAILLNLAREVPLAAISVSQYDMAVNPTLPAVPLFTLAGYFLAEGGASKRLVRVFHAVLGHLRGGTGVMTVLVCAFFTSFTGASGVTILALGGLLMPVLLDAKYSQRQSLGIITGAGSLGLLLPPCLPLILYAIVASNSAVHQGITVSIEEMFAGGILPGLLLVVLAGSLVVLQQPKSAPAKARFSWKEAGVAVWSAKWELFLPVIALGALLGGFATPVEAAALTAFYAFFVETFIYRDLKLFRDVPKVLVECGLLVGGILLILGVAIGLTNYIVDAQVPDAAVEWAKGSISSAWLFLIALNLILIVAGCLMDIYSALVIIVPIIVPVAIAFDVNLVHLGVIFLANLQLGYLTPPVGMNLFMTSYRFGTPMSVVVRSILPMVAIYAFGVLVITFVPVLSTWLPGMISRGQ